MDIKSKAVLPTSRLELRDGNDELIPGAAANLYGPGSKRHADATARQQNRLIDSLKRKGKTEKSAEQQRAESAEFLADITGSFEGVEYDTLTDRALALAVYSDITIGFIADQVAEHIRSWSNFTQPSTKS